MKIITLIDVESRTPPTALCACWVSCSHSCQRGFADYQNLRLQTLNHSEYELPKQKISDELSQCFLDTSNYSQLKVHIYLDINSQTNIF